ncbi:MAG: class I SAM-dependent methyltransferase [Sphingobacteriia bacterium]|jgi:SAM-dependent methyltransferase|nr:MAG: class I SAM-dependent methyltransferase [Sphingobacteriia bacterium]TAG32123.1 MAG: class I SAM-dependent methyltransferase [Sphingobacteriia bacterium]TAH09346.1 MAG: class I SAM-dependent methyltransferase [Sphingobacteriia bacterium]
MNPADSLRVVWFFHLFLLMNMVPANFNPTFSHPLYFIRKGLFRKISFYAPQLKGRLMDFGCGEKPYQSLFNNVSEYIGLDYDGEGHNHANERIDIYYDGVTIPFPDQHFDSVFSSEVFEHLFTLPQLLPQINRVMKVGGQLLITCPFAWEEHEIPIDFARYTRFALTDLLEKNGFKILVVDKNGHFVSALHQLLVLYIVDHWMHKVPVLSNWNFFKKLIRHGLVPIMNAGFYLVEPLWPKSDRFYLNTIVVAEKQSP